MYSTRQKKSPVSIPFRSVFLPISTVPVRSVPFRSVHFRSNRLPRANSFSARHEFEERNGTERAKRDGKNHPFFRRRTERNGNGNGAFFLTHTVCLRTIHLNLVTNRSLIS